MTGVDARNVLGGLLVALVGLLALLSAPGFGIGTPRNMGAGFFPMALGIAAIAAGLLIAVPALFRAGAMPAVALRPAVAVAAAIAAFALVTQRFGYLPGVAAATALAAAGDRRSTLLGTAALAAAVTAGIWFVFALNLQIAPAAWKGF